MLILSILLSPFCHFQIIGCKYSLALFLPLLRGPCNSIKMNLCLHMHYVYAIWMSKSVTIFRVLCWWQRVPSVLAVLIGIISCDMRTCIVCVSVCVWFYTCVCECVNVFKWECTKPKNFMNYSPFIFVYYACVHTHSVQLNPLQSTSQGKTESCTYVLGPHCTK